MKKLSTGKKVILGIVLTIIILVGGAFVYAKTLTSKMDRVQIDVNEVKNPAAILPEKAKDVTNIALFGTDYMGTEIGSTDTMMILSINKKDNTIKLCSLMRDTYVDLPDGGKNNLNYVVHDGGIASTIKAINYNFDLDIEKFVQVNLYNLPKVIDLLGGVEINLTAEESTLVNSYIKMMDEKSGTSTPAVAGSGKQNLTGMQAAAYCRIRKTDGKDYKRTERQRDVLEAIFKKVKDVSILEVPGIVSEILPLVTTNLSDGEIFMLAKTGLSMNISEIEQSRFPLDGHHTTTWTDMYHILIEKEQTTKDIHEFIYN